jgi:hypothetical protein
MAMLGKWRKVGLLLECRLDQAGSLAGLML